MRETRQQPESQAPEAAGSATEQPTDDGPTNGGPTNGGPTRDELLALLRQERADFQNYRRRVADDRAAELERARGQAVEPIFPLLDDLARAVANVPPELESHPWAQGISLLGSRLSETLKRLGLETVGAPGEPFDPTRHEAVVFEPDPGASGQTIGAVIRPGYRIGGRLLRPAEVVVRGQPDEVASGRRHEHDHAKDDTAGG
jgi:molecular chaperone GrpE